MLRPHRVPARRLPILIALLAVSALTATAGAQVYKPVKADPNGRDADTLFLATFNKPAPRADFARGNPTVKLENVRYVDGRDGKAIEFQKDGLIHIQPQDNILREQGTIELVLKDTHDSLRHMTLAVGDGANATRYFSAQLDRGLWWQVAGTTPWIHDVDIRQDLPREWMHVVLGWDLARGVASVAIFTADGRLPHNRPQYWQTGKLSPQSLETLKSATIKTIQVGSPGLVLDSLRISGVYRTDLLELEQDWGPVEQFGSYNGRNLYSTKTRLKEWNAGGPWGREQGDGVVPFDRVIRAKYEPTGRTKPAVPAVRFSPGRPVADLDLGTLDIGCYVIRVIAAVKTEDIEQYRKPVLVDLKVNDQPGGGVSHYRHRVPYWDDFYAVTELYFNADEKRPYRATLTLGEGSMADLYVHAIELHDVLSGLPRVAAKTRPSFFTLDDRQRLRQNSDAKVVYEKVGRNVRLDPIHQPGAQPLDAGARRQRDDLLWQAFPPINSQFVAEYDEGFATGMGPGEMSAKEAAETHGAWQMNNRYDAGWNRPLAFTNDKLNLTYTRDDLAAHRPLPDPYPFKDTGTGVYFPKQGVMEHAHQFMPLAVPLGNQWTSVWSPFAGWHGSVDEYRLPYLYHALDNQNAARDAAFLLARWAWTYPTHTDAQTLGYAVIAPASMYNRDMRLVLRGLMFYRGSSRGANLQQGLTLAYDFLFPYIKGNQELAGAVGRYIPWVKSDEDLRGLIETRILQFGARQSLHFQLVNSKEHSVFLLNTAVVQQDPDVTRPWMASLWQDTHIYPHPNAGLPDFLSTTTQRDGTTDIGSVFYTWAGSPFLRTVALTRLYVANGGDPKFDLSDFRLYGKMPVACAFPLDAAVAGGYPLTIGDVGGPAKPRLFEFLPGFEENFRYGWNWTRDPRFAWLLKHYYDRKTESDQEWKAIEDAAARQARNPFLAQESRVMANWAGILESGQDSDDYRFKRTAYLRVGVGHGHAHADTLDLQMLAHGVRVANDLGHRGSYTMPKGPETRIHNRVEVNSRRHPRDGDWQGHAWIGAFKPWLGAQYMRGQAVPPSRHRQVTLFTREVALIDVDAGTPGTQPPSTPVYQGNRTSHDPAAVTANSYVFDVQRVAGGTWPTFNFHGTWSDDFDLTIRNRRDVGQASHDKTPRDAGDDAEFLHKFLDGDGLKYAGDAPADGRVVATWRLRRAQDTIEGYIPHSNDKRTCEQKNAELQMLGADYDEKAPRKFTRLHLLGRQGDRLLVGHPAPVGPDHAEMTWPHLMVQKRAEGEDVQAVYPAIVEPYAGEPFIRDIQTLPVVDNEDDALMAVALRVATVNGFTDLCFSDGRPEKTRRVADAVIAGRFAYVSADDRGLRMLHLVEGTSVQTPLVKAAVTTPAQQATIASVDYPARQIVLDQPLPATVLAGQQCEIGNPDHRTSFTIVDARRDGGRTILTLDKPADLSYAQVRQVDPTKRQVTANIGPATLLPGMDAGLTLTNGDVTRAWKCRVLGRQQDGGFLYQLESDVAADDLPVGGALRLWEYGAGDTVRIPTHVYLRRLDDQPGAYELRADAPVEIRVGAGASRRVSLEELEKSRGVLVIQAK